MARSNRPPSGQTQPPHRITVILSIISLALAVVSVAISWQSFHMSQASLSLVQRAYLLVRPAKFEVGGGSAGRPTIEIVYEVENLGNTPALNVHIAHDLEPELGRQPASGILPLEDSVNLTVGVNDPVQIAPKDHRSIKITLPVDASQLTRVREYGLVEACVYSDVFGAIHKIEWTCKFGSCTDPQESSR